MNLIVLIKIKNCQELPRIGIYRDLTILGNKAPGRFQS